MRILASLFLLLVILLSVPREAFSQALSPFDREKLRLAEKEADQFVERFRQTLDFGTVWREFQVSDASCTYKANGFFSENDYKRLNFSDALLERLYIAFMNYYFISGAYSLSTVRIEDENPNLEKLFPKRVLAAERKTKYVGENKERQPQNASEVEEMIAEFNSVTGIHRSYIPRNVMRTATWRANIRYLLNRGGITHLGVGSGHESFCIPESVKYYIVDRGLFYFYFVEEKGSMKVAGFGIGS